MRVVNMPGLTLRSLAAFTSIAVITLTGCGYALSPVTPAWRQRLRLVPAPPQPVVVRFDSREYDVSGDGSVTLEIPAYRRPCRVYLFGLIRIPSGVDPLTTKRLAIIDGATTARSLSLRDVSRLPLDADGYHLLPLLETGKRPTTSQ